MDFRVRTCSADQGTRLRFFAIVLSVVLDGELQLFGDRDATFLLALIIASPVAGLRPIRAARFCTAECQTL
jgi:hypothetical protein